MFSGKNCSYRYLFVDNDGELRGKIRYEYPLERLMDNAGLKIPATDILGSTPVIPVSTILPNWSYDGSSTGQAETGNSEVIITPMGLFFDPFVDNGYVVLTETFIPDPDDDTRLIPHPTNNRILSRQLLENAQVADQEPWFGIEQEFTLFNSDLQLPYMWNSGHNPYGSTSPELVGQHRYYCAFGGDRSYGRQLVATAAAKALEMGLQISGTNAEVMASQWEIQVGPCRLVEIGDHLLLTRWVLRMVSEQSTLSTPSAGVSFAPKPWGADWNGSGGHTNFSTRAMRGEDPTQNAWVAINQGIKRLSTRHRLHMDVYGKGNEERMTGDCETASYDTFSYGVASRKASIRIPRQVYLDRKGYIEDRRPAGNLEPYLVTNRLVASICLDSDEINPSTNPIEQSVSVNE